MGEDGKSPIDLTGDEEAGGGGEAPKVAFVVHAGEGAESCQADFNGAQAGEPADESAEVRRPPTPVTLVWPGTVIGAVDHGG